MNILIIGNRSTNKNIYQLDKLFFVSVKQPPGMYFFCLELGISCNIWLMLDYNSQVTKVNRKVIKPANNGIGLSFVNDG